MHVEARNRGRRQTPVALEHAPEGLLGILADGGEMSHFPAAARAGLAVLVHTRAGHVECLRDMRRLVLQPHFAQQVHDRRWRVHVGAAQR